MPERSNGLIPDSLPKLLLSIRPVDHENRVSERAGTTLIRPRWRIICEAFSGVAISLD
jgi:hypothetical protein